MYTELEVFMTLYIMPLIRVDLEARTKAYIETIIS